MDIGSLSTIAGILAILLGASAIVGALAGSFLGGRSLRGLEETIRLGLNLLSGVAVSLEKAGEAAQNAGGSIDEAKRSLGLAARMGSEAASVLVGIGSVADVNVLGIHPLRGLREMLKSEGEEIRLMADQLRSTAGSMGDDADNMKEMAADLGASGKQIANLVARLSAVAGPSLFRRTRTIMYALSIWGLGLGLLLILCGTSQLSG